MVLDQVCGGRSNVIWLSVEMNNERIMGEHRNFSAGTLGESLPMLQATAGKAGSASNWHHKFPQRGSFFNDNFDTVIGVNIILHDC